MIKGKRVRAVPLGTALFCFFKMQKMVIEQTEQIIADKFD